MYCKPQDNMSFSRLPYDTCSYKHQLAESIGSGEYQISTPNKCDPCFVPSPSIRLQRFGDSLCPSLVDVDSELMGLTRKATKDPCLHYAPQETPYCTPTHLRECNDLDSENSRLSNPPCTMRCRGWNRWEWLCKNPQDNALITFDWNVSNRIVVKDNHRPHIEKPLDQTLALPNAHNQPEKELFCGMQSDPHPLNYRTAKELAEY